MHKAADMHGCALEVAWRDPPYLPTINNLEMTGFVEEAALGLVGPDRFLRLPVPTMAAEDFGYMAREFPRLLPLCIMPSSPEFQADALGISGHLRSALDAECIKSGQLLMPSPANPLSRPLLQPVAVHEVTFRMEVACCACRCCARRLHLPGHLQ